nr:DUF6161 domain-containing protein [Marinobacter sp. C7]
MIAQWSEKNEELLASLEQHKDEHEKLLDALTTSQSDNLETLRLTKNSFNQAILGLKHAFDDFLKDANQSLESVRETYRKHMSLRASVDYWSDQANEHEQKAKRAFTWLIIFTLVTIFTFLFAGALIVLSATPEDLNGSAFNLSYGHAIKGLVAALLLSFLIWSIKLSNKTWHIHKHLHQDAKERVTMMKTYLALASEEKNLRENDVELILNSLFRPAYDGIIKDDTAPRSLMDFIMRDNK